MKVNFSYCSDFDRIISSTDSKLLSLWGIDEDNLDINKFFSSFINGNVVSDVSVDSNANVYHKTVATLFQEFPKPFLKLNNLFLIYKESRSLWGEEKAKELLEAILTGLVYPNDLTLFCYTPYCYNYSTTYLAETGLPFITKIPSTPAKHADSFIQHLLQLIMFASNHTSGATGVAGVVPTWSHFVKRDKLSSRAYCQQWQWFLYTCNQPVRFSHQSPFVNITFFDRPSLEYLYKNVTIQGERLDIDFAYELQKDILNFTIENYRQAKNVFTFPIITINLSVNKKTKEFIDKEFVEFVSDLNSEFATFNFFFSYSGEDSNDFALASCCRLLNKFGNFNMTFGAGGEGVGAVGSVVVNLPRIGLMAEGNRYKYFDLLDKVVGYAQDLVYLRRHFVKKRVKQKLLPLYDYGFMDFSRQFLIVGINGMYESYKNLTGYDVDFYHIPEINAYVDFATDVLNFINNKNREKEDYIYEKYNDDVVYNIEQVPAENLAIKFAEMDRALGYPAPDLYSNQWVPLVSDAPILSRIKISGKLDPLCGGGAILHLNIGHPVSGEIQRRMMDQMIKANVVYSAFNYDFTKCLSCNELYTTKLSVCPSCGSRDLDYFYRIVGFITNVNKTWSKTRRVEYHERKRYN